MRRANDAPFIVIKGHNDDNLLGIRLAAVVHLTPNPIVVLIKPLTKVLLDDQIGIARPQVCARHAPQNPDLILGKT